MNDATIAAASMLLVYITSMGLARLVGNPSEKLIGTWLNLALFVSLAAAGPTVAFATQQFIQSPRIIFYATGYTTCAAALTYLLWRARPLLTHAQPET